MFASKKESPERDSIVFRALLPLTGTAVIVAGVWASSEPVDITPSDSDFALVSEPFPEEIFAVACVTTGSMILIMRLLRK